MRRSLVPLATLALALALAAPADAKRAGTHRDEGTDFTRFQTYRWQQAEGPAAADLDHQIRAVADEELKKKGLRRVAIGEAADLEVRYNAGTADQLVSGVMVTADWWGSLVAIPAADSYATGGISFIVAEVATDKVIWTGWKVAKGTTADAMLVMRKRAPKYAREIVSKYPE